MARWLGLVVVVGLGLAASRAQAASSRFTVAGSFTTYQPVTQCDTAKGVCSTGAGYLAGAKAGDLVFFQGGSSLVADVQTMIWGSTAKTHTAVCNAGSSSCTGITHNHSTVEVDGGDCNGLTPNACSKLTRWTPGVSKAEPGTTHKSSGMVVRPSTSATLDGLALPTAITNRAQNPTAYIPQTFYDIMGFSTRVNGSQCSETASNLVGLTSSEGEGTVHLDEREVALVYSPAIWDKVYTQCRDKLNWGQGIMSSIACNGGRSGMCSEVADQAINTFTGQCWRDTDDSRGNGVNVYNVTGTPNTYQVLAGQTAYWTSDWANTTTTTLTGSSFGGGCADNGDGSTTLCSNGSITTSFQFRSDRPMRLTVRAKSQIDSCAPDPAQMEVWYDGNQLVGNATWVNNSSAWADYNYFFRPEFGTRSIVVKFINDHATSGCGDRNLIVYSVVMEQQATSGETWTYCASEGGSCTLPTGTLHVRYGTEADWGWAFYWYYRTLTGGTTLSCNSTTFGGDPHTGYAKTCWYKGAGTLWKYCANEGTTCSAPSGATLWRFGDDGEYRYKQVSGTSMSCDTTTFGGDPLPGSKKSCAYGSYVDNGGWTFCSGDNAKCKFAGTKTVAYGSAGKWIYREVTGMTTCSIYAFGGVDPNPGVAKNCYYR